MYADDTIAAIATAAGQAGVGIVRVSGRLATDIATRVFTGARPPSGWESHRLYVGRVVDGNGTTLDQGLAVLMRQPRSYTGEDVLELHCHGSPVVLRTVLGRVLGCGARLAEPGEFTKRAFLNGRLDLAQAEAVIDMIRARTNAGAALAAAQLSGRLSESVTRLRDDLITLKSLIEAQIDFSEEDFVVNHREMIHTCALCIEYIEGLLTTYERGRIVRDGLRVAIVGKPNVGKSSLLNALLGDERAIVTPIAGTTRDVIEEAADFDGVPVVLSDTAGLRESQDADVVERIGMERTAAAIGEAALILAVLDTSAPLDDEDRLVLDSVATVPHLVVLNKMDLPNRVAADGSEPVLNGRRTVAVSAAARRGLDQLRRAVLDLTAAPPAEPGGPVLVRVRHVDALRKAVASLQLARRSIRDERPAELVAVDVQDAIDHLGAITGAITSEDVLDRIFAEFCIGK